MQRSGSTPSKKLGQQRELKELCGSQPAPQVIVDIPELSFLMSTGLAIRTRRWDTGVEASFSISYRVKFVVTRSPGGTDYGVMSLEGLWWVDDLSMFSLEDKSSWSWTAMIMQPDVVTEEVVRRSILEAAKRMLPAATKLRFEGLGEGLAAQVVYKGPYSAEGPSIGRHYAFIAETGHRPRGKHHEIYLKDPWRSDPAKLMTIIRQPIASIP